MEKKTVNVPALLNILMIFVWLSETQTHLLLPYNCRQQAMLLNIYYLSPLLIF